MGLDADVTLGREASRPRPSAEGVLWSAGAICTDNRMMFYLFSEYLKLEAKVYLSSFLIELYLTAVCVRSCGFVIEGAV